MAIRIGGILYSSQEWYDEHITGKGKEAVGGVEVPIEQPKAPPTVGGVQEGIDEVQGLIDQGIEPPQIDDPPAGDDVGTFGITDDIEESTPEVTDLDSFLAGEEEAARLAAEKEAADIKAAEEATEAEEKSWWEKITGMGTQEEAREEAYEEIGFDQKAFFKKRAVDIAEMRSMRASYDAKMKERDDALAGVAGVGMPQGWMDDRKVVITNKYNAELNHIGAKMNSLASMMALEKGSLDEAQEFADEAVADFVADLKFETDRFDDFVEDNEELLKEMGEDFEKFVIDQKNAAHDKYVLQKENKTAVMKLMQDAKGQAGITIEDTLEEANQKASKWSRAQVGVEGAEIEGEKLKETQTNVVADINRAVDQYRLNPEGFRERFIESLVATYGEGQRNYINNQVYSLMPDIEGGEDLLTPAQCAYLKVPFGTTVQEAASMGITPERWKEADEEDIEDLLFGTE